MNRPDSPVVVPTEEPPPFFSWKQWYLFVLSFLGILIVLFYIFTKSFE